MPVAKKPKVSSIMANKPMMMPNIMKITCMCSNLEKTIIYHFIMLPVECVDEFCYLRSLITSNSSCNKGINARVHKTQLSKGG